MDGAARLMESPNGMIERIDEKRFSLKGATLVAAVSVLVGFVASSMTVYADISARIRDNEKDNKMQAEQLASIEGELRGYRMLDARLAKMETNLDWMISELKSQKP